MNIPVVGNKVVSSILKMEEGVITKIDFWGKNYDELTSSEHGT